jgi:hypothetical protein
MQEAIQEVQGRALAPLTANGKRVEKGETFWTTPQRLASYISINQAEAVEDQAEAVEDQAEALDSIPKILGIELIDRPVYVSPSTEL